MGWTIIAVAFIAWLVLVVLFTPRVDYRVTSPLRPDSDAFLHVEGIEGERFPPATGR